MKYHLTETSVTAKQNADDGGDIGDVDSLVTVDIGSQQVDAGFVAAQQVIDECCHVGNADVATVVHVARDILGFLRFPCAFVADLDIVDEAVLRSAAHGLLET